MVRSGSDDYRNLKTQYKGNKRGSSIQRRCSEWGNGRLNGDGGGPNGIIRPALWTKQKLACAMAYRGDSPFYGLPSGSVRATWLMICWTKMTRTWMRLARSGRNSVMKLSVGASAQPSATRLAVEGRSVSSPGT